MRIKYLSVQNVVCAGIALLMAILQCLQLEFLVVELAAAEEEVFVVVVLLGQLLLLRGDCYQVLTAALVI